MDHAPDEFIQYWLNAPDCMSANGLNTRAMARELIELRALILLCAPIVVSSNQAEHILDGFGPRSRRPSDELTKRIEMYFGYRKAPE